MNLEEFEENNLDVLQNIEAGIVACYRSDPNLTDYCAIAVLEALNNIYVAEITGRTSRPNKLSPQEQVLFKRIKETCEWRLGRGHLENYPDMGDAPKTVEEISAVLKKLIKSAKTWNRESGRQGYLNYIIHFIP
jgi:hypothetical protein